MSWNYENWLEERINVLSQDLGLSNFNFVVEKEQLFSKRSSLTPNTIYVVIKNLSNTITLGATTQPVQILILSEQNSLETTQLLFSTFAKKYNFYAENNNGTYVKHQYAEPVVLSNFNTISYGYRSILYLSTTLYIMENVIDVKDLTIDGISVEPLSFSIAYAMSGNTQPISNENLSTTVKSVATLGVSLQLPMLNNYVDNNNNNLINKIVGVMNGSIVGNVNFVFDFYVGSVHFSNINMKLISADVMTAPAQIPSLQLGFQK